MSFDEFEDDWAELLRSRIQHVEQVKADRAEAHQYFARRRHWGLKARHAAKLARQAPDVPPTDADPAEAA